MFQVTQSVARRYCHSNSSEAALCRVLQVLPNVPSVFTSRKEQISNRTVICKVCSQSWVRHGQCFPSPARYSQVLASPLSLHACTTSP